MDACTHAFGNDMPFCVGVSIAQIHWGALCRGLLEFGNGRYASEQTRDMARLETKRNLQMKHKDHKPQDVAHGTQNHTWIRRRFCGEQLLQVPTVSATSSQTTRLWALVDMISFQVMPV
ncbi:unnamed protein product [Sphagnum tenellum]